MLPRLSELRLKAAPVHVGAPTEKRVAREERTDDDDEVSMEDVLPREVWQQIMNSVDDKDACNAIGRICKAGGKGGPIRSLCKDDATYDQLNKSLGWYKPFENRDEALAWWLERGEKHPDSVPAKNMVKWAKGQPSAREYFTFICKVRRLFLESKRRYEETSLPEDEKRYRSTIELLASSRGAPGSQTQAKWMVGIDPAYAFEFIPGSCTTMARWTGADLKYPRGDPVLEALLRAPYVMGIQKGANETNLDAVTVEGYTEIAKIAVGRGLDQLKHVRGSIDIDTGARIFEPCEDYEEIAEVAVAFDGSNLRRVPGSTLSPGPFTNEVRVRKPVSNYATLAKLAASSKVGFTEALMYVPGSISAETGMQLRSPIDGYRAIAEAHIRRHPRSLKYVPGSRPRSANALRAPRLDGYAALAKIAIVGNAATFELVPLDLPEYAALEALRDQALAIWDDPDELEGLRPDDPNYVALAKIAIARRPATFGRVPPTLAAYAELKAFRDRALAIEKDPETLERVRRDDPEYSRLEALRDQVVAAREMEAARQ